MIAESRKYKRGRQEKGRFWDSAKFMVVIIKSSEFTIHYHILRGAGKNAPLYIVEQLAHLIEKNGFFTIGKSVNAYAERR